MTFARRASCLVPLVPVGPVDAAALVWRAGRELQLTVMAKARLGLEAERTMRVLEPTPLVESDRHHGDDATRSLAVAAEVVPFRPQVDVTLTGHAAAPRAQPAQAVAVRFALLRSGTAILDKVIHAYGDRVDAAAVPSPFDRLPLVYERALGGPGHDPNPVGTGLNGRSRPPNLVEPSRPGAVAGFGPISRYWRARRQFVSSEQRRDLERLVPSVGSALDWSYFQAAPLDQQLERLDGDEWVVLDGVHPEWARIQSRLPALRAFARLVPTTGGPGVLVAMVVDGLAIDADTLEATMTFRGVVRLGGAAELARLRGIAGFELDGVPTNWTEVEARLAASPTLLESLPAEARELLGVAPVGVTPSGFGARGSTDDPLLQTDVDLAPTGAVDDPLLRTVIDVAGEPTLRSRVSSSGAPQRGAQASPDTLKNIDVVALRASMEGEAYNAAGGEEHPFEWTIPTPGVERARPDPEDTAVNLALPSHLASGLEAEGRATATLADEALAGDGSPSSGGLGKGPSR